MATKKRDYYKLQSGNKPSHKRWEKSQGIHWKHEGFELFLEKVDGTYKITEARTGLLVVSDIWKDLPSIAKANEDFKLVIEMLGIDKLKRQLETCIERYGVSPLYQEEMQENVA